MAKKGERSLLLLCMVFVFACLLLSGGWRLVGRGQEDTLIPERPYASIRAALSSIPAQTAETVSPMRRAAVQQRVHTAPAPDRQALKSLVQSDANGNVLGQRSYMHEVYHVFSLGDGFA